MTSQQLFLYPKRILLSSPQINLARYSSCHDLPWTGLLASGDGGCHRWMAVGVSSDTLEGVNNNRTTWTHDTWTLDT